MRMPLAFFLAAMFIVSVDALRAVSQPVTTFTRSCRRGGARVRLGA